MNKRSFLSAPLRIGLITPAWPGSHSANGIATTIAHLARGLEACGHEVTIIPFSTDASHNFSRVVPIPTLCWRLTERVWHKFSRDPEGIAHRHIGHQIVTAVQEAITRHRIEVLVMEETHGWAATVCRHIPIPVVVTLHGPWCLHKEFLGNSKTGIEREKREFKGLRLAQGITAPSRDTLERTAALCSLLDIPRTVIHNPILVPPASNKSDPTRILFVGRFDFLKGGDVVIEAFARIAGKHPSCRLTFVGPDRGLERPGFAPLSLAEAVSTLPETVRTRIDIKGQCSREEVAALRLSHGLTIVASRFETFSCTMSEAMAAGSALVCTRSVGGAEILSEGETALLIPPDDPQALAEACLKLLGDPELTRKIGASARAYVRHHLSPEAIGQQTADFLASFCRN